MSEKDLAQKVAARKLLWQMGYSTRIDVVLRAEEKSGHDRKEAGTSPQSFTDLDVLGVAIAPSGKLEKCIVDCKTGNSSVISRMFWVRGLQEFFGADSAYMVRDRKISQDALQLASKLGINALTERDVDRLSDFLSTDLPLTQTPLSALFDARVVADAMRKTNSLDRRLKHLLDYRQFGYWILPANRNLIQLPDALFAVRKHLNADNKVHFGLVLDSAWLYLLSLAECIAHLRIGSMSSISYRLSEYLAGGLTELSQKREIAELLVGLQEEGQMPSSTSVSVDPRFFTPLLELVTRLLRHGLTLNTSLRILEFQTASALSGRDRPASSAFKETFDRRASKLAVDVIDFLVDAAELSSEFSNRAREGLMSLEDSPNDSPIETGRGEGIEKDAPPLIQKQGELLDRRDVVIAEGEAVPVDKQMD